MYLHHTHINTQKKDVIIPSEARNRFASFYIPLLFLILFFLGSHGLLIHYIIICDHHHHHHHFFHLPLRRPLLCFPYEPASPSLVHKFKGAAPTSSCTLRFKLRKKALFSLRHFARYHHIYILIPARDYIVHTYIYVSIYAYIRGSICAILTKGGRVSSSARPAL